MFKQPALVSSFWSNPQDNIPIQDLTLTTCHLNSSLEDSTKNVTAFDYEQKKNIHFIYTDPASSW